MIYPQGKFTQSAGGKNIMSFWSVVQRSDRIPLAKQEMLSSRYAGLQPACRQADMTMKNLFTGFNFYYFWFYF